MSTPMTHAIDWFEIPVRDLDRAQRFYETALATTDTEGNRIGLHAPGAARRRYAEPLLQATRLRRSGLLAPWDPRHGSDLAS